MSGDVHVCLCAWNCFGICCCNWAVWELIQPKIKRMTEVNIMIVKPCVRVYLNWILSDCRVSQRFWVATNPLAFNEVNCERNNSWKSHQQTSQNRKYGKYCWKIVKACVNRNAHNPTFPWPALVLRSIKSHLQLCGIAFYVNGTYARHSIKKTSLTWVVPAHSFRKRNAWNTQ